MIIPIKKILLEFTGAMGATKQNHDGKLTPKTNLKVGIPPENNGTLTAAKTEATKIQQPVTNIAAQTIRDTNIANSKAAAKAQYSSQSK